MIKPWLISVVCVLAMGCNHSQKEPAQQPKKTTRFHRIAFLLYENFDTVLLNAAISEATAFYHCDAIVLPPKDLPAFAFYEPLQRYKADSLLKFQSGIMPVGAASVVAITNKDISTSLKDKQDWGIFGLGYCPGTASVISVFRLKSGSYDQIKERFIKVVLHELGHNMGLPHCKANEYCLMNDAKGTSAQVDKEKKWLCPNCQKLLSN